MYICTYNVVLPDDHENMKLLIAICTFSNFYVILPINVFLCITHTHTHTYIYAYPHTHKCISIYTHTHAHTYIHTYMYIPISSKNSIKHCRIC